MIQNTTKNDKWEQCDTKDNTLKIYFVEENIFRIPFVPPSSPRASKCLKGNIVRCDI